MAEAQYVSSGDCPAGTAHYGLGIDRYTHFTSPIRRYADIVVHRQLLHCLESSTETPAVEEEKGYDLFHVPTMAPSLLEGKGVEKEGTLDDDFLGELVSSGDEELSDGFMDELLGSDDSAGEGGIEGVSVNGLSNESSKDIPANNSSIISANDPSKDIPTNNSSIISANDPSKDIPTNNSSNTPTNTSEETPYSQSLSQLANHRRSLSRHSLQ